MSLKLFHGLMRNPVFFCPTDHRVSALQREARAVLDGSAVGVRADVAAVVQELVEQGAVRRVDLESGFVYGVRRRRREKLHVFLDFFNGATARRH